MELSHFAEDEHKENSEGKTQHAIWDAVAHSGAVPHRPVSIKGKTLHHVDWDAYPDFPFLQTFGRTQEVRNKCLEYEGRLQHCSPKSTSGWLRTLFVLKGRALDWVIFPWLFVTIHACVFVLLDIHVFQLDDDSRTTDWQTIFTFALNSTLGFLLVFRLNRAAVRYWTARERWGVVTIGVRTMTSGLLIHGSHDPSNRDEALRWLAAFPLAACHFIRGEVVFPRNSYEGILSKRELIELEENSHPPLFVTMKLRYHVKETFCARDEGMSHATAIYRTQQLDLMERTLNQMVLAQGSMERIQGTPLPLVYVTHLRTFLLINLLLIPWVWGPTWGWSTVPVTGVVAFAFLGIEAASAEVEIPFRKDRTNALDMNGYAKSMLANMLQLMINHADTIHNTTTLSSTGTKQTSDKDT